MINLQACARGFLDDLRSLVWDIRSEGTRVRVYPGYPDELVDLSGVCSSLQAEMKFVAFRTRIPNRSTPAGS